MRLGRGPDPDAARRVEESLQALEAGGLPVAAQERLAQLHKQGAGFYTSDLSVNEFLLIREAGFRAVSQVMGSCFYSMGWQSMPGSGWGSGGFGTFGIGRVRHVRDQRRIRALRAPDRDRSVAGGAPARDRAACAGGQARRR
jgi:hypothetical protein